MWTGLFFKRLQPGFERVLSGFWAFFSAVFFVTGRPKWTRPCWTRPTWRGSCAGPSTRAASTASSSSSNPICTFCGRDQPPPPPPTPSVATSWPPSPTCCAAGRPSRPWTADRWAAHAIVSVYDRRITDYLRPRSHWLTANGTHPAAFDVFFSKSKWKSISLFLCKSVGCLMFLRVPCRCLQIRRWMMQSWSHTIEMVTFDWQVWIYRKIEEDWRAVDDFYSFELHHFSRGKRCLVRTVQSQEKMREQVFEIT